MNNKIVDVLNKSKVLASKFDLSKVNLPDLDKEEIITCLNRVLDHMLANSSVIEMEVTQDIEDAIQTINELYEKLN